MALVKCKECGHTVAPAAKNCPNCGNPRPRKTKAVTWVVAAIIGYAALSALSRPDKSSMPAHHAREDTQSCTTSDIEIKSMDAGFVDECRSSSCPVLRGAAVLTNNCKTPVGVQVKMTGIDDNGTAVATDDFWPASVNNIPPGDYPFSLDQRLKADQRMKSFSLRVVGVKAW